MSSRFAVSLVAAALLCVCGAQLEVTGEAMQSAVDALAARFSSIRNEGLGINSLEVFYTLRFMLVRQVLLVSDWLACYLPCHDPAGKKSHE